MLDNVYDEIAWFHNNQLCMGYSGNMLCYDECYIS